MNNPMMGQLVERMIQRLRDGGKRQREVFARLSILLEELELEVKRNYGERSGKLSAAYGHHYMPMKSRFSAKGGIPPKQLYSTYSGWVDVLKGFARELGRSEQSLLAYALDRAFDVSGSGGSVVPGDYAEVFVLIDAMKEHVTKAGNLEAINEYVSRSGLFNDDGAIGISEVPRADAGFIDGMLYSESDFDFVPQVFGINAVRVAEVNLEPADILTEEFAFLSVLSSDVPSGGIVELEEARLVGLAIAVEAASGKPELAFLEWDRALAAIKDGNGTVIRNVSVRSPRGEPAEMGEGYTGLGDGRRSPEDWHPTGIRIYFRGNAGFNRLMQSTLVRPWIWTNLNPELWRPIPDEDFETYPVSTPAHTVAAFIEGNLLYADEAGRSEERIDRLLVANLREIEAKLTHFREQGEVIRRPRHAAILSDWGNGIVDSTEQMKGASE